MENGVLERSGWERPVDVLLVISESVSRWHSGEIAHERHRGYQPAQYTHEKLEGLDASRPSVLLVLRSMETRLHKKEGS